MKALRLHEFGDLSNLRCEEIPDAVLAPDEVRVRVVAASINPSDAHNIAGRMEGTTLPRVPGRDFAGIVVEGRQFGLRLCRGRTKGRWGKSCFRFRLKE
jgi:NADPH:quinone reductase-like Zn-dependent oxidoreductase